MLENLIYMNLSLFLSSKNIDGSMNYSILPSLISLRGTADKTRILYAKTFFGYENSNFSTLSRKIRVFLYPKWT